ncbi:hypothetical protein ACFL54_00620 [Planctomycetota bacterium]
MDVTVLKILREKIGDKVPTIELYSSYPGYEREITLIAMSELPMDRLSNILSGDKKVLSEVTKYREYSLKLKICF